MAGSYTEFVSAHEGDIKRDIKRLIDIKSVKDEPSADAPYGEGVRRAQLEAMKFCSELGMEVVDCDGRIAYAHYGPEEPYIGIIAHIDVVPEGNGWESDPFCCTELDGFLVGRGVLDDKGPFVVAAYAVKYLIDNDIKLNYGIRLIMGLDEETGMGDVEYYKQNYPQPIFAFTPDAAFPVGHGEKGLFSANLVSPEIDDGAITELHGGVASNVVADYARALLAKPLAGVMQKAAIGSDDITVSESEAGVLIEARGRAAHAGKPHSGINANHILAGFLAESGALSNTEKTACEFIARASSSFDGEQFGIACDDGIFTPLTVIGGIFSKVGNRLVLNINSRYPTVTTADELERKISQVCAESSFTLENIDGSAPFYMQPDCDVIKLMCGIYNEVTGSDEKPFVMSGGTYARRLSNAVSYGLEFPDQENEDPEWVGSCHMKNEGLKIERAKLACEIYINTLVKLQQVKF
ncbi:MAG: Sapep family Mn(2+)-dependent dipeptidase [Oscillospiraceae bacterium]